MAKQKSPIIKSLTNLKSRLCTDPHISDLFVHDVLRITGLEFDNEGYIVDPEENPLEPEYILIKNKVLRYANAGVLHANDIIFDPYNMPSIMDELFRRYLSQAHPNVISTQILAKSLTQAPRIDTYGYISILYSDGSKIVTQCHYKDSTKYLEAFMRLESMTDKMINDTIGKYDEYEAIEFNKERKTK